MKKGIVLGFCAAGISGVSIFVNAFFVSKTDPLIFAIIRNIVVAVLFTILLQVNGHIHRLTKLSKREWGKLIAIGAIGGGIPFALFFIGIREIGAVNANIIQKTLFLWVAMLAVPFLHERLSKLQLLGYGVLFLGMFVFGGTYTIVLKNGTWFILGATILWAVENIIAKMTLKTVHPIIVSWGRMIFGLPFLLAGAAITGKLGLLGMPSSNVITPMIVSSVLLLAYMMTWYSALSRAPATLVSSILVLAPIVTAALGAKLQLVPLVLLSTGVLLVVFIEAILKRRESLI